MKHDLSGLRVTVMGLGLHGGGLASTEYLVSRGARVTVTDLRSETELADSLERLPVAVRTVIGRHEMEDFTRADLVVKNPAVPRTVTFLQNAKAVTTDIALFLSEWRTAEGPGAPVVAITGTKGKSSTSGATAHILAGRWPATLLGGNITVSPLTFLNSLPTERPNDVAPVVLELSSFQLGDLAYCRDKNNDAPPGPLPPSALLPRVEANVAVITNIFRDHQDYYGSMERYVADKEEIFHHLPEGALALFDSDSRWSPRFLAAVVERYRDAVTVRRRNALDHSLVPEELTVVGQHSRGNLAYAAAAAAHLGVDRETIRARAASFPGVPHRLETLALNRGCRYVNDTAATIPEAALAAVQAFRAPLGLIAGGTDKGLNLRPLVEAVKETLHGGGEVFLLAGTATDRLVALLAEDAVPVPSVFTDLSAAVEAARRWEDSQGPAERVVLLSPGCASFGMFRNEFDRGDQFRSLVAGITE